MSGDYISRKAAYNAIINNYTIDAQLCDLDDIPAADVVEVRHGRWHRYSKGSGSYNGVIILSDAFADVADIVSKEPTIIPAEPPKEE